MKPTQRTVWGGSEKPRESTPTSSTTRLSTFPPSGSVSPQRPRRTATTSAQLRRTFVCIYEYPLSEHAVQAESPLQTLPEVQPIATGNKRYELEMGRGERLFASRRYDDARTSFLRLKPHAANVQDSELVSLRLAEIEYFQKRYSNARESLRPFLASGPRQAEARFFYLMSERGLRNDQTFVDLVRALQTDFPDSTWTEEALNHLATFFIQQDRDDEADAVLREMYAGFPRGRYADRAAWKAGWASYRRGDMREAVRYFESAAASFPRSDYRPAWLYWSGRARAAAGDTDAAIARYQLTIADYHNTYYGRLAAGALRKHSATPGGSRLVFAAGTRQIGWRRQLLSTDGGHHSHAPRRGLVQTGGEGAGVRAGEVG